MKPYWQPENRDQSPPRNSSTPSPHFNGWPNDPWRSNNPPASSWRRNPLPISALIAVGFLLGALTFGRECPTLQENAGNLERAESTERAK